MTRILLMVITLPLGACAWAAAGGRTTPRPEPTFGGLAHRCGMTVQALDSLLTDEASRTRQIRGIDLTPAVFGAILGTRLPAQPHPVDCAATADTISHTLLQGGR